MANKIQNTNQRIARNTVYLYIRTFLTMLISLYTSRVVLSTLGVVDYGVNNVVAGVVMLFAFLNGSMSGATQRFLTFAIGKKDTDGLFRIFGNARRIHAIIAIVVALLCETIGLWLVNYKLVIPAERMIAANWVFQLSVISLVVNITQVPYNAAIIAHEKMDAYALISIAEAVLRLVIVYILTLIPFDKLIVYAILTFTVTQIIRTTYYVYCKCHFEECSACYRGDNTQFKEMFQFAGWNMFGSIAWMIRDQGVNMILNVFFGPVVNAARGIAMQVSTALQAFVNNFTTAINPQITKNYAQGNIAEMETLAYRGSRFAFLLLFIVAFPLMMTMDFVLGLWLTQVPEHAANFLTLILIDSLISALFSNPLITSLMATGKIRVYQIVVSACLMLLLPLGYLVLDWSNVPETIFMVMIFTTLLGGIVRYIFCIKQIGYHWQIYVRQVIVRVALVVLIATPLPILIKMYHPLNGWKEFIGIGILSIACCILSTWFVGIQQTERKAVIDTVRKKIKKA